MPKPTITEQIEALALLREYALIIRSVPNPTDAELEVMNAINTLDNADLFADLDEEAHNREAAEHNRKQNTELAAEWGDTTREDMAAHQIGLPEMKPGETARPAFSDTHPRRP